MNRTLQERVAPFIALLVIFLTVGMFLFLVRFDFSGQTSEPVVTSPPESPPPALNPSPEIIQDEYSYHLNNGELQVALYHLEADSLVNGWASDTHIRAGNLWRDMGDKGRALPHWEAANAEDANANLLRQIVDIYLERGDWGIAWERIQTLLPLAPNDARTLYNAGLILAPSDPQTAYGYLGRVAALNNEYSDTAQEVLDAIGDTSTGSDVIMRVGATLALAEEWSLAENAYQYAADLYFPFAEATAYTGLMRILQGKSGESWINEAIALDSDNPDVRYIAGVYWRSAGEFSKSEDALVQAIILNPENPIFHAELGNTYREMGNILDAEVWLQTAVIISENNPLMVEALENFYADEELLDSQTFASVDGQTTEIRDPSAISANGLALHIRGDSEAGLELINQALAIDPQNPRALFDKARVLLDTGRTDEAIPLLEALLESNTVFAGPAQGLIERDGTSP